MNTVELEEILSDIRSIDSSNLFLEYIVNRLRSDDYRGWHVSQHNRYSMEEIRVILAEIYTVSGIGYFAIPPGDYKDGESLDIEFTDYTKFLSRIKQKLGKCTINSLKKNFFPDLEKMNFLIRKRACINNTSKPMPCGKLTPSAVDLIESKNMIDRFKKFTDGIDKLFGDKISDLADMLHLSDFSNETISIYEFMFILSDNSLEVDKIEILNSYRTLKKHEKCKVISLIKQYANPSNFYGDKTTKRDFHNWKNQIQQIMKLLKTTVYFEVESNKYFRLNVSDTGFFQQPGKRSRVPKNDYFLNHSVSKKEKFDLHHIIPISAAHNKEEAKLIDDWRNLIYIHRNTHKRITENRNKNVVLAIDPDEVSFSDFDRESIITAVNEQDSSYSRKANKLKEINRYNQGLLKSIYEFLKS